MSGKNQKQLNAIDENDDLEREINEEFDNFDDFSEEQEKKWEERMLLMNNVSKIMGELLLNGWTMEKDICKKCNTPLFTKDSQKFKCPHCNLYNKNDNNNDDTKNDNVIAKNGSSVNTDVNQDESKTANNISDEYNDDNYWGFTQKQKQEWKQRQKETDLAANETGKLLLQGWTMLAKHCPKCQTPLMSFKKGKQKCPVCDRNGASNVNRNTSNNNNMNNIKGNNNNNLDTTKHSSQNHRRNEQAKRTINDLRNNVKQKFKQLRERSTNNNDNNNNNNIFDVDNSKNGDNSDNNNNIIINAKNEIGIPSYIKKEMEQKSNNLQSISYNYHSSPYTQSSSHHCVPPPPPHHPHHHHHSHNNCYYPSVAPAPPLQHNRKVSFDVETHFWLNKTLTKTTRNLLNQIEKLNSTQNFDPNRLKLYLECIKDCMDIKKNLR